MITAIQLIFSPAETWEKVTTAQRGFIWTVCLYLLPLLVVSVGIEAYLMTRWGEKRGDFGGVITVSPERALQYACAYIVLLLVSIFFSAKFLAWASESFNVPTNYAQCFTVMAYGFGPIILARILDGAPQVNTWLCWAVGVAASVSVFYHGIGVVLRPDQTKGFGLYLMAIVVVVLLSALSHFSAQAVLHGKMLHSQAQQIAPGTFVENGPASERLISMIG
jgi:hypothetical protein